MRQAAHLREGANSGGAMKSASGHVEIKHLREGRGDEITPPGEDAERSRPTQSLAAGKTRPDRRPRQ
jgi:hypothetical protein